MVGGGGQNGHLLGRRSYTWGVGWSWGAVREAAPSPFTLVSIRAQASRYRCPTEYRPMRRLPELLLSEPHRPIHAPLGPFLSSATRGLAEFHSLSGNVVGMRDGWKVLSEFSSRRNYYEYQKWPGSVHQSVFICHWRFSPSVSGSHYVGSAFWTDNL